MKKFIFNFVSIVVSCLVFCSISKAQEDKRYVRKPVSPNFFIPSKDLAQNKQEKVFVPRYKKGTTTAKKISADDNYVPNTTLIYKPEHQKAPADRQAEMPIAENENTSSITKGREHNSAQTDTPDYQKMYQNYLRDLESIATTGNVNNDAPLSDLNEMNSESRISIDQQFNQKRNVDKEIEAVIGK